MSPLKVGAFSDLETGQGTGHFLPDHKLQIMVMYWSEHLEETCSPWDPQGSGMFMAEYPRVGPVPDPRGGTDSSPGKGHERTGLGT